LLVEGDALQRQLKFFAQSAAGKSLAVIFENINPGFGQSEPGANNS
jgi:hypothetical protein